jgi:SSS family solute:Na+ symporter
MSLALVIGVGLFTQRYMRSVSDFLSAGRVARRYLLAVSKGEMAAGAVVFVALFELLAQSGFTQTWWGWVATPVLFLISITGFVVYRYRETRAMTVGQFFEIRYSKSFRKFAGILAVLAGVLNFGIIPAIGARFMVYILDFPTVLQVFSFHIPTFVVLMAVFLAINLFITLSGGLITIMMTNCVEGIVSQILYLVLIFGLLAMFPWSEVSATLCDTPPHQSLMNPLDSRDLKDFNIWFTIMSTALAFYATMAWQNQSAYQSAPLTAHEGRMGGVLGRWRDLGKGAVVTLLGICALTYLHDPHFAEGAKVVREQISLVPRAQDQEQMLVPVAVSHLLPVGMKGALCAILLLGIFGGDSNHLHSWGSLIIQDVVLPFRREPYTPQQHIRLLRWSIFGVAAFAFLFGALFPQTDYIIMYFTITGSIYLGGAGAALIGGLYWKKGTAAGAWVGLITGSVLSVGGIIAQQEIKNLPFNGVEISFGAMFIAIATYIAVSLLTCREDFNMDRMLHRGKYAAIKAQVGEVVVKPANRRIHWGAIIGFDENFTRGDKWVAGGLFAYTVIWLIVWVVGTIWNYFQPWSLEVWSTFWHVVAVGVPVFISVVTGIWFTWGGIVDSISLFKRLEQEKANPLDSGMVVNHQNLDEAVLTRSETPPPESSSDHSPHK